jgi:hypothetical protein
MHLLIGSADGDHHQGGRCTGVAHCVSYMLVPMYPCMATRLGRESSFANLLINMTHTSRVC